MKEALKELNNKQIGFICNECAVSEKELFDMDDDILYDKVYEVMCNIEMDEVCSNNGKEETERCETASDIVTILGNTLARDDED